LPLLRHNLPCFCDIRNDLWILRNRNTTFWCVVRLTKYWM
jgi:hypothetical protein